MQSLSVAKKNAIWADLIAGTPPKYSTDAGPNAAALAVMQFVATIATLSAADLTLAKVRSVAIYVQDNPNYLVNPAFDPTINVPGRA